MYIKLIFIIFENAERKLSHAKSTNNDMLASILSLSKKIKKIVPKEEIQEVHAKEKKKKVYNRTFVCISVEK